MNAADINEIQNLVATYCLATDDADAERFMDCWVPAEEFGGYDSGPFGKMDTWEALYEFEKEHVGPGGMANGKRHQSTNIQIEFVSEAEARVTNDLIVLEVAETPAVIATGRYNRSVVVKIEKGWKFKRRTLDIDPGFFKLIGKTQEIGTVMNDDFVNDQTDYQTGDPDYSGPVMLVNIFTPLPGEMDAFIAAQTAEYKRLLGKVEGWIGNRLGLSLDGDKAVNVAVYESREAYQAWRESEDFKEHLDLIAPFVKESAPGIYKTLYAAGDIP